MRGGAFDPPTRDDINIYIFQVDLRSVNVINVSTCI